MKHLTKSKESLKRNYPLEHQKQLRKFWKNQSQEEKEKLILGNMDNLPRYLKGGSGTKEEGRKEKMFHMVVSLVPGREESLKASDLNDLVSQCLEYLKTLGDTCFIDSLLFPTLEQMSSIPRFALHDLGRFIFKTINDLNFSKLFTQLEEKDKAKKADTTSKASKKKSSKKSSQKGQPTKEKDETTKDFTKSPGENSHLLKAQSGLHNSTTTYEEELHKLSREYMSEKGGWIPSSGCIKEPKKANPYHKKRRSNDFNNKASSGVAMTKGSDSQKAQSMYDGEAYESMPDIKRTMSFTNNVQDELHTVSNNRTLSTKTESKILRSQEVTNIYDKPGGEVREEDDMSNYDETFDRKSNRGSVDYNQNSSSVDPKNRNLRTNSIEREVKKKLLPSARAFKPLQKGEYPLSSSKVLSNKDKKEAKLVNLYSENAIKEIMMTTSQTKPSKEKGGLKPNRNPRNSHCAESETAKLSPINPERKKASSNTKLDELSNSPLTQKLVEKTPTKAQDKKQVFSAMINKIGKWEIDELDLIAKEKSAKMNPVTLNFDPSEDKKPEIHPKIDIKKGFQKYLSGPMSLEQGELFFKNYLNYNINECVSRIKASVNASEPLRISAFKRVRNIISQSAKSAKTSVVLYGSWATGLMTENSDIDVCIKRFEIIDRMEHKAILESLEQTFKCFKWALEVKGIYTAMVPVLKLVLSPHPGDRPSNRVHRLCDWG
jgi:predicted nucleotidyltransferase